jgi:hypothetical protein
MNGIDRREDTWKAIVALVATFVSGAFGAFVGLKTGVAVLESQQAAQEKRMDRIENELKQKVDKQECATVNEEQDKRVSDILARLNSIDQNVLLLLENEGHQDPRRLLKQRGQ